MMNCGAVIAAVTLTLSASALAAQAVSDPPTIGRHRPAPPVVQQVPPMPLAHYDPELEIGGDDLKARQVETRLTVPVRVNGRGPYNFIVDSGADTSVIGARIARTLDLPLGQPAVLIGVTSRDLVARVKVDEFAVGSTSFRDMELPALREADVGGDGMIGIDALVHQRLLMDFEKGLIKIEDGRVRERVMQGDIVITAKRRRGQLILTQVRAGRIPLDAVIDTGTQVTIGNTLLRDQLLHRRGARFRSVQVTGVTGVTVNMDMAIIPELQLGPITLRDVPIAFADVPPFQLFGLADEPALLLGTDLLEAFRRVSLDFHARKIRFQLKRCQPQGFFVSTWSDHVTRMTSSKSPDVCGR